MKPAGGCTQAVREPTRRSRAPPGQPAVKQEEREKCGSSPSRRTHQARTWASRWSQQCLNRRLIEPGTTMKRPHCFEGCHSVGLQVRPFAELQSLACGRRSRKQAASFPAIPDIGMVQQSQQAHRFVFRVSLQSIRDNGFVPGEPIAKILPLLRSQSASGSGCAVRRSCQSAM